MLRQIWHIEFNEITLFAIIRPGKLWRASMSLDERLLLGSLLGRLVVLMLAQILASVSTRY